MKMDGARDEVFAYSAFASQQHGRPRWRYPHHRREDRLHAGTAADDIVPSILAPELFFELAILFAQIPYLKSLADHGDQLIEGERLQEEIGGARFHRLHGVFHRAE